MGFADQYLGKQKGFTPGIADRPPDSLSYIVVIPVYCEPDIAVTLESLWNCIQPRCAAEVILVVNSTDNAAPEVIQANKRTVDFALQWIREHNSHNIRFYVIHKPNLPAKDAGVGLARKTGMDEAIYRFNLIDNPHGTILSFDADSQCEPNYLMAVESAIQSFRELKGFSLYFEHPLEGGNYSPEIVHAITQYELHLRYVNQYLRYSGFPYAHHTVGSCFGVRADAYVAQGGMNKRKGGEDFYFLHKIIPLGNYIDLNTTCIVPSPRLSDRVPFGTGPALQKIIASGQEMQTYAPESFRMLKIFLASIPEFYNADDEKILIKCGKLPQSIRAFLEANQCISAISEINRNSATLRSFVPRFYRWFDALRIIQFLNYCALEHYPRVPVAKAARELLKDMGVEFSGDCTVRDLLILFRKIERGKDEVTK
jgi:glycosyltransferase involved in cell wall biosynthesis